MKLYYALFLMLLLGCESSHRDPLHGLATPIEIDNRNIADRAALDELIEEVEWQKLETSREAIIGNTPFQMVARGDRLFLLYSGINSVLAIFDLNTGKFINKIAGMGSGPGEFTKITSFSVHPGREVLEIAAGFERKVLEYDFNGNFLSESFFEIPFTNHAFLPTGEKIIYSQNPNGIFTRSNGDYELLALSGKNAFLSGIKSLDSRHPTFLISGYMFFGYRDSLRFVKPFCDTVFQIFSRSVLPRYVLHFKKGGVGKEFWDNPRLSGSRDEICQLNGIPALLPVFFENDRLLFGVYQSEDGLSYHFIYDKQGQKVSHNFNRPWYREWDIPLPPPLHISKEGLMFLLTPGELKMLLQEHPNPNLLPEGFRQAIVQSRESDNPFLLHLRFKG